MTATLDTSTTATTSTVFDQERAEQFGGRVIGLLNDGSLALLYSLGHRLGLFDALTRLGETTSSQVATATGYNERYVREWLGGATTGGIVEYDPTSSTYHLPPEHAASLTRAAGANNLARLVAFVPLLAQVEDQVAAAFRDGGGVPYTAYGRFHRLMAEMSGEVFDAALIDTILPLGDGLPQRLTTGIEVADIGCGSGHAVNVMAQAFPASRFVGYDFSEEAIEVARAEARELGVHNARFEVQDVALLSVPQGFDLITAFDAIHDQAHPGQVLDRIHDALRPGGTFLMADIRASSHLEENLQIPWSNFLYTVSLMHCMTVSLALDGEGLGTVWGEHKARGMLDDAGFVDVQVHELEEDPLNSYYLASRP